MTNQERFLQIFNENIKREGADKLLEFIGRISSAAGDSKTNVLSSLAGQYDGMKIGFELTRKTE